MASRIIRRAIHPPQSPKPIAPYSPGILVDKTLYVSGQVGVDRSTGKLVDGTVPQAKQALENMGDILRTAGADYKNVVKTTVLLADIKDFQAVNEVYRQYFKDPLPARTAYQVSKLPLDSLVEIDAVAVVGDIEEVA